MSVEYWQEELEIMLREQLSELQVHKHDGQCGEDGVDHT